MVSHCEKKTFSCRVFFIMCYGDYFDRKIDKVQSIL